RELMDRLAGPRSTIYSPTRSTTARTKTPAAAELGTRAGTHPWRLKKNSMRCKGCFNIEITLSLLQYYHCARSVNPKCTERSVTKKDLEQQIKQQLCSVHLDDYYRAWMDRNVQSKQHVGIKVLDVITD